MGLLFLLAKHAGLGAQDPPASPWAHDPSAAQWLSAWEGEIYIVTYGAAGGTVERGRDGFISHETLFY